MIPGLSNLIIDPLPPRDNHCVPSVLFSVLRARPASTEKAHWCSTFCGYRLLDMCLWAASHQLGAQNTFPPTALALRGLFLGKGSQPRRTSLFVEKSHLSIICPVSQIRKSVVRCVPLLWENGDKFSQIPFLLPLEPGSLFSLFGCLWEWLDHGGHTFFEYASCIHS